MPVPSLNSAPQTVPQLIPVGWLTTVPATEPVFVTSSSIDVIEPHETVSRVVPTIFWDSAETVVVPHDTAVASPVLPTVATGVLLEDQVAMLVRSTSPPPTSVPKATNWVVCPIWGIVGLLGRTVMDCNVWFPVHWTVSCVWPMTPWYSAVMVVVPQAAAVARPVLLTVAIATLLDAHVAVLVRSLSPDAGEYIPIAMNCVVCPIWGMVGLPG